jgi:beta-lactamase regulating signal transducer with metallopeptidase domain
MIIAIIGYGFIVAALVALAAWLVERALVALGRPRKYAWMGGIVAALLVPALVIGLREPGEGVVSILANAVQTQVQGAATPMAFAPPAASPGGEADRGSLEAWLAALWALTSIALIAFYAFSAWRLARRARSWHSSLIDEHAVSIAPDIGPAVFGWLRSQVVFPRWLVEAPDDVRRLALAHEREHLAARDPQILSVATLVGVLLPWNLPLHWMLRRLRFAMEVDCDARVIRQGADPSDYGLALLYVSERQSRAPITAIALIGRKSQLERRINFMFASQRKYPVVVAGLCLALAAYCVAGAAQLPAPGLTTAKAILKPPPGMGADSVGLRLGQTFEVLLRERYPELLQGNFTGTPVIVVLLNEDMTVANSAQIATIPPDGKLKGTPDLFAAIGLTPEQVPITGMMNVQVSADSPKKLLVVYTERGMRSENFVSRFYQDTRKQDRELFLQQFPEAQTGVAAGMGAWLLMDRNGAMLRKGLEPITPEWDDTLRQRYKGITTQEMTVTNLVDDQGQPLRDVAGKNVHLYVVWLAPGSPLPAD